MESDKVELSLALRAGEGTEIDLAKALEKEIAVIVTDPRLDGVDQTYKSHGHGVVRQVMFNFLGIVKETDPPQKGNEEGDKKQFLLLFEEPEIYLHPVAVTRLRALLYELCEDSPFQFLCATHSPALIDLSKPHTSLVRVSQSKAGETSVHQVGEEIFASSKEQKKRVQMVNKFNPHACEAFFAEEVIVVEGDTEAIVLRTLLENVEGKREVFVLNSGSKNNIPFFQEVLTHFGIRQHVIHDSDCRYQYDNDGQRVRNKDRTDRANSAWGLNDQIWGWVEQANERSAGLARRYVFVRNFEHAHDYKHDPAKGKPLSAYEFAADLAPDGTQPVVVFLRQILGDAEAIEGFTPEELEQKVREPDEPT